MNNNLTEIVFILDRSGSMSGLEKDTIGGFNSMIERQKGEEGEAIVSTVLFSNHSKVVHDRVNINDTREMTYKDYFVGGTTALIDAMGDAIRHIEMVHKYAREEDVPNNTIFIITTDGMENASHKYSSDEIKAKVEKKKKDGWEFMFLGANIDAIETARSYGISEEMSATFQCDEIGTAKNFVAMGAVLDCVRKNAPVARSWKDSIESHAKRSKRT